MKSQIEPLMDVVVSEYNEASSPLRQVPGRSTLRRSSGFTLIELMIVVAIIAIIAAIAIPNLIEARKAGNESAAIGSLRTVSSAQAISRANTGIYAEDLATLGAANLIDNELGQGTKSGYTFNTDLDPAAGTVRHCAFPGSPWSGDSNFCMVCDATGDCEIRHSDQGAPDASSPLVPENEGDAADPVPAPPGDPPPGCPPAPDPIVPTSPAARAAAAAELQGFYKSFAVGLAQTYAPYSADLAKRYFLIDQAGAISRTIGFLDANGNEILEPAEINLALPPPPTGARSDVLPRSTSASLLAGQFSAANLIAGVIDSHGSCEAACAAAGEPSSSCETACSESIAAPGEVEGALDGLVSALPFLLDVGVACEEDWPGAEIANLSGDPSAFLLAAFGASVAVPALSTPWLWLCISGLSASGLVALRRRS